MTDVITLADKFKLFDEVWSPRLIGELNGQYVKLAKCKGQFVWHSHSAEDEFFQVIHGQLLIHFRDKTVTLNAGDCLIVAVNSDASTRRLKGAPRPLLDSNERTAMLAALPSVDYLTIFDGDTPEDLIRRLKPNVLVKGATPGSSAKDVVGHEIVSSYGGEVRLVSLDADDTRISKIIKRAQKNKS